jgi:hypothetical protein
MLDSSVVTAEETPVARPSFIIISFSEERFAVLNPSRWTGLLMDGHDPASNEYGAHKADVYDAVPNGVSASGLS